jgi:sulfite reductase (NADPH) hemoprotein beta-component
LEGQKLKADRSYAKWLTNNVQRHKQPGYSIVVLSLKAKDTPPGDVSDSQMLKVADLADQYSLERLVVTHSQNLVLTDVETQQLPALYAKLVELDMATPNFERVTDAICCPGLDYCSLANARSIPVSLAIAERFADIDFQDDIGRCSIKISGCINACGHHHIGNIGILGIDKHGEEAYQLMLGGCESDSASIGKVLGPAFKQDEVVDAVDSILRKYLQIRTGQDETFLECFRRLGMQPFKDAAYASHQE